MKLSTILEASQEWSDFSKSVSRLEQALNKTAVRAGNPEERGPDAINFEMVNDIQHSVERIQKQLDQLDRRYKWREYMAKKKERVFGK